MRGNLCLDHKLKVANKMIIMSRCELPYFSSNSNETADSSVFVDISPISRA